jgi:hypothetical protein
MAVAGYDENVFINCPFDDQYAFLFQALVFTVLDCGFQARCALEVSDSSEVRIAKITRIISECRLGIHDISRTQLDRTNQLPRFNMPLELGIFLGAKAFGDARQKRKRCVVLDETPYRYQAFCSDIAGQDIRSHENDPARLIRAVRHTLATASATSGMLRGANSIFHRFTVFRKDLPSLCSDHLTLDVHDLQFIELRTLTEEWIENNPV